jgi:hypothetical protein
MRRCLVEEYWQRMGNILQSAEQISLKIAMASRWIDCHPATGHLPGEELAVQSRAAINRAGSGKAQSRRKPVTVEVKVSGFHEKLAKTK